MKTTELFTPFREKYAELKKALKGTDIEKIRKLTLEVHAMVPEQWVNKTGNILDNRILL